MRWRRYPEYKDSGVEWLGSIPRSWSTVLVKHHWDIQLGKMLQNHPQSQRDRLVPYLKALHVLWGRVETEDLHEMFASPADIQQYGIQTGDLLVCEGGEVGRAGIVALAPAPCIVQNALHRVRSREASDVQFLQYVLSVASCSGWFDVLFSKATIAHFTREKFAALRVPFPPSVDDQRMIATFLDRETERIDTLIAKKERQIELLQEKRAALISHAVTKGLDPSVPMKDSGVEWLGEIPAHWEKSKLRFVFESLDNERIPLSGEIRAAMAKNYPYYGASGIIDYVEDYIFDESLILVAEDGANLLSRSTPLAFIARGKYWVNNHAHILRPKIGPLAYWEGVLQTFDYTPLITGAAQPKLTKENLGGVWLPLPQYAEQCVIADYLEQEAGCIDTLIREVQDSANTLQEYRTALISAAVTGKIDVREEEGGEV